MKKITALFMICVLLMSALLFSVQAAPVEYKAAYGTPTIDGKFDEMYKESSAFELTYGKISEDGDTWSTAKIYWLWDENNLYYYAKVTDDTPSTNVDTTVLADIWKTDCLEVGFNVTPDLEQGDPHNTANSAVYLASVAYGANMDIYGQLTEMASVTDDTVCVATTTATGWAVEVKLAIFNDETELTPEAGNAIAMYAILHNDTDNDNARNTETYTSSNHIGVQYNSELMDVIILQPKPVEETEAVTDDIPAATIPESTTPPTEVAAPPTMDTALLFGMIVTASSAAILFKKRR